MLPSAFDRLEQHLDRDVPRPVVERGAARRGAEPRPELGIVAQPAHGTGEALGVTGIDEQRVDPVVEPVGDAGDSGRDDREARRRGTRRA